MIKFSSNQFSDFFPLFPKTQLSSNPMKLLQILLMVFYAYAVIFSFCECGEMITSQFNMFREKLGRCKWYLFPIEMQQMLVVVTANAQHPTILCGFGNTVCIRESFKMVCAAHKSKSF